MIALSIPRGTDLDILEDLPYLLTFSLTSLPAFFLLACLLVDIDLLKARGSSQRVLINNGLGFFTEDASHIFASGNTPQGTYGVLAADFDNDGGVCACVGVRALHGAAHADASPGSHLSLFPLQMKTAARPL